MIGGRPTVLLLHGAFEDASTWSSVITDLQAEGLDVMAPTVPLRSLTADAAYIAGVARQFDGPILLIGHDYGGAVASLVGSVIEDVVGIVYVAGIVLDAGQCIVDVPGFRHSRVTAALRPLEFRTPDGAEAVELYLRLGDFGDLYAADLPGSIATAMAAAQRPIAASALEEPAGSAAWQSLPTWYLVATADRVITPASQREMAARAASLVVEVQASHAVTVVEPAAVVALILRAARDTPVPRHDTSAGPS
jgi:pimeloyl-ACP methyl ester carboxylesterase